MMTPEKETALREYLLGKSVKELIDLIVAAQDELQEAKEIRRRLMQIRNLCLDPEQRAKPGRPRKNNS